MEFAHFYLQDLAHRRLEFLPCDGLASICVNLSHDLLPQPVIFVALGTFEPPLQLIRSDFLVSILIKHIEGSSHVSLIQQAYLLDSGRHELFPSNYPVLVAVHRLHQSYVFVWRMLADYRLLFRLLLGALIHMQESLQTVLDLIDSEVALLVRVNRFKNFLELSQVLFSRGQICQEGDDTCLKLGCLAKGFDRLHEVITILLSESLILNLPSILNPGMHQKLLSIPSLFTISI